jgi:hypothetical protein
VVSKGLNRGLNQPSSLRMYFSANVNPVSFLSTMRTLPNAPLPTTRSKRKWLRFTIRSTRVSQRLFHMTLQAPEYSWLFGALPVGLFCRGPRLPSSSKHTCLPCEFPILKRVCNQVVYREYCILKKESLSTGMISNGTLSCTQS